MGDLLALLLERRLGDEDLILLKTGMTMETTAEDFLTSITRLVENVVYVETTGLPTHVSMRHLGACSQKEQLLRATRQDKRFQCRLKSLRIIGDILNSNYVRTTM